MTPIDEKILQLRALGLTREEIAERTFRTTHAVAKAITRLRRAGRLAPAAPYSNPHIDTIMKLRDEGMTYTQIAQALGVTKGVIAGALHRAKPKQITQQVTEEVTMHIWELSPDQCRYSVGENERGRHIFCGELTRDSLCPYCVEHAKLCYISLPKKTGQKFRLNYGLVAKPRRAIRDFATQE
jgi:hypothetical protein